MDIILLAQIGKVMNYGKILDEVGNDTENAHTIEASIGDTVIVHFSIHEGDKDVEQKFKGIVIADRGRGRNRSITLRTISQGIGVERVFPLNSSMIRKIDVLKRGKVTKAKLYHLRGLKGKAATTIQEKKFVAKTEKEE